MDDVKTMFEAQLDDMWATRDLSSRALMKKFESRWVRFHMLPGSKRFPSNGQELEGILARHKVLMDELNIDNVFVITTLWSHLPSDPRLERNDSDSEAKLWCVTLENPEEADAEFRSYRYEYVSRKDIRSPLLHELLTDVANDTIAGLKIVPINEARLYMPYDGGVDIICDSAKERDRLKVLHRDWLSNHPSGL